ncbi:chloride channel protein [Schaalia meyeri]|uniref:chloride channel protein n=1 Tax=Schaalia meyeri TaxID=52773 RepID=UPI0006826921|nr:chloride channel protein [Schaalia meyeri]AKU65487.1 chloride channel protein [Schaalia meyeri]
MLTQTRRLAVATIATGVIAGVVGLMCIHLLHWIQALAWDMHSGTLLQAVSATSPARRVAVLALAGTVGSVSWYVLFRRNRAITSVSDAVDGAPMPPLRATWHALTQILIVGFGASIGREVAPREMAAAFSAMAAERLGLSDADRRIIVACGAGAGLAAVYSIPLSGAIYTLEILLVSLSARAVAPALITCGIAVLVSTGFARPSFFYTVPTLTPSLSLTVFGVIVGPLLGAAGWAFRRAVARVGAVRPRGRRILVTLPVAFTLVGLVSTRIPSVLGNGQASAQTQFDATWAAGTGFVFALLVLAAKTGTTFLTIRAGGWGGVLTPALALGAGLGAVIGLPWATAWPGSEVAAFALIGAAAFLGASMKAPFTGLILVIEFTGQGATILVPAALGIGGATAAATWLARRT